MKIGIIGGTGWLGGAIARALLDTGFVVQGDLSFGSPTPPAAATGSRTGPTS
jgi:nucleoside-diphosphate-sugar epimerase